MSRLFHSLLLAAALVTAAGRPACCVADVFLARGCCAEAAAVAQARKACSCCQRTPVDAGVERWSRAPASCRDDCACCASNPVVAQPANGDGPRSLPATHAGETGQGLLAPPVNRPLLAGASPIGERAPRVPSFLPLLL